MNDGMIFYRGFYEAISWLSDEDQLICYRAIAKYGLTGEEPDCVGPARAVFESCKAQIDANNRKRENGKKGGETKANNAKANSSKDVANPSKDLANSSKDVANPSKDLANSSKDVANPSKDVANPSKDLANSSKEVANKKEKEKDKDKVKEKVKEKDNNTYCRAVPDGEHVRDPVKEVIDYLNQKAGTDFRSGAKSNREMVMSLYNDGYQLEDFREVIDKKTTEWLGTKNQQYLCPNTLFKPENFENYRGQRKIVSTPKNQFMQFDQHSYNMDELTKQAKMRSAI